MERKGRIHGYYYDGETQWVMYEDEDGYIETVSYTHLTLPTKRIV